MKYAAAYVRRSSVSADSPGDASKEAQLAAVRAMCGADVEIYQDWGISGQKADRPDYVRLKADVAAGKVGSICAYSLSRLGRSSRELLTFVDLCRDNGVTIRTTVENLDTSTAMGVAMLTVMAAFAQLEADSARERQASARKARIDRGDDMSAPYGYKLVRQPDKSLRRVRDESVPLDRIFEAYREAGTVLGACVRLEEWGIPAPRGGKRWATSALTRILERENPGLLPRRAPSGLRSPGHAPLAQLLRCPFCGRMLTPNTHRSQYYCANGAGERKGSKDRGETPIHARYTVREVDVLPWVQEQAERHWRPPEATLAIEGIEGKRDAIDAQLERFQDEYIKGRMKPERYEALRTQLERDAEALTAEASAVDLAGRSIAWDGDVAKLNDFLRAVLVGVDLDENLRPVHAEPRIPEWWQ